MPSARWHAFTPLPHETTTCRAARTSPGRGAPTPTPSNRVANAASCEEPSIARQERRGRQAPGGRDVAGDPVDRLHVAAVALAGAGIQDGHPAQPRRERDAVDRPRPGGPDPWCRYGFGRRERRDLRGDGLACRPPRVDPAVEDGRPCVPERVEHPPQACRHRSASVVVGDDPVSSADAERAERRGERRRVGKGMATRPHGGRQHRLEIHEHGARQVRGRIGDAARGGGRQRPAHVRDPQVRGRRGPPQAQRPRSGSRREYRIDGRYGLSRHRCPRRIGLPTFRFEPSAPRIPCYSSRRRGPGRPMRARPCRGGRLRSGVAQW